MMSEIKIIFLLGGHDLEMVEIRSMLENAGYNNGTLFRENDHLFFDNDLEWGAKWSDYKDVITNVLYIDYVIYGVELTQDMEMQENWRIVDHHNDLPPVPTAIDQIAKILGVTLTRWQELVAANDHGYKGAMRNVGATEEEIQEIRFLDRKAQGVTMEMEDTAKASIQNAQIKNGIRIIKTDLYKFSPITDRLNDEKILVYNNNFLCYYGINVDKIANMYHDLIMENKAYYGGGKTGFFGLVSGKFSVVELENKFIMEIIELN